MEKLVYLVEGQLMVTPYMNATYYEDARRIVYATSRDEAQEKFEKHFNDKSDPYSTAYYVCSVDVVEPIL